MQTAFASKPHFISGRKYPLTTYAQATPPVTCEFGLGAVVTFTNDYGVQFHERVVTGFSPSVDNGRFVYLDMDCWWFPVDPTQLSRAGGVTNVASQTTIA